MKDKSRNIEWNDVKVMLNGVEIGPGKIKKIEMVGDGKKESFITNEQADEEIILRSVFSNLDLPKILSIDHEETIKGFTTHVKLEGKVDMITVLKRIGLELQFGVRETAISYKNFGGFELNEDAVKFLSSIKKKEWDEAPE